MADGVFNIAKGRIVELAIRVRTNDPANAALVAVLLQASEDDATLEDHDTLDAVLAEPGNTQATFTNYVRLTLTDADLGPIAPDDANNRFDVDIPDLSWGIAGGAVNNTLAKLVICYDSDTTGGDDSDIVPLCHYDFTPTTDGVAELVARINAAGFFRAA